MTSAPLVSVRGEATVEADPELAALSITVIARDADRAKTLSVLSERAAAVTALIERFGSGIERSSTSALHVYPELADKRAERVRRYAGRTTHSITVKDFEVLSRLISAAAEIELCEISGPWWQLRADSPVYRSARLAAVRDAMLRAREYAEAFGAEITGLVEVADQGMSAAGTGPGIFSAAATMTTKSYDAADQPFFDLEPARQEVTGQVEARFTMSEPSLSAGAPSPGTR